MVCCDPPYYSNIGYADLSDFFYVWLRRALSTIHPLLFATLLTPKVEELVASTHRYGNKDKAREFFVEGLTKAFHNLRQLQRDDFPLTVFYSFKQAESSSNGHQVSTGWEVMLDALLSAGFSVGGTWPMRTENVAALKKEKGALATSIVLVCRPRAEGAPITTRRQFLNLLKAELPDALRKLQQGNIAPVDLAQAAIGPGMGIFSRFSKVLEADGSPMTVGMGLGLINQILDEILAEQEREFDSDTRWALTWFEQHGFQEGPFGDAETLSKAKDTSVDGMVEAGILAKKSGISSSGGVQFKVGPAHRSAPNRLGSNATTHSQIGARRRERCRRAGEKLGRTGRNRTGPRIPAVQHLRTAEVASRRHRLQQSGRRVA